ncbi:precorrin-3B C(17)-methyltransferase [Segnochrobactraceae bacterium EtOH-i3]
MTPAKTGWLRIVGLGPGPVCWIAPEAADVLFRADALIGYGPYVARIPHRDGLERFPTDNRVELDRARHALELAANGRRVAVVSGGDPGVFAMAAAVFEAVESGPVGWRDLDIVVVPGISAMQAAAARAGAPLGGDFCAISLSDNLKSWPVILRRLTAAADADFVIALYNPASKARPDRIREALALLGTLKDLATPVILARAVGRPDEALEVTDLAHVDPSRIDMSTLVLIGASTTRLIPRLDSRRPWVYTPRSVPEDVP